MPLKFGVSTDLVNCGDGAAFRDCDPCTLFGWGTITSVAASGRLIGKGLAGTGVRQIQYSTTQLQASLNRATSDAQSNTNFANFAAWVGVGATRYFLAATLKSTGGVNGDQKFYLGTLAVPAAEPSSYGTQSVGSGANVSNSGTNLIIGNRSTGSLQWTGLIWIAGMLPVYLTLGDVRWLQYASLDPKFELPASWGGGAWRCGVNGTGPVYDITGTGNHGTITSAVPTSDALPRRGRAA